MSTKRSLAALTFLACSACVQNAPSQPSSMQMAAPAASASASDSSVAASLSASLNFNTHLNGDGEVPMRDTLGQGQANFKLNQAGTELTYKLIATNIDNVIAAHIHMGPAGVNGPIVAFLYGSVSPGGGRATGVLATGTITAANLIGPLSGKPLSDLLAAIHSGNAYVNVHTNDGVNPINTGAGDFPGGEIRGQLP